MATVAAYVRVSSASQSADMQREAIGRAANARGEPIDDWYGETFTGATTKRPELDRLREAVREGRATKLYVWRLDRLTRSGIRDTLDVVEELTRHGCELTTIADGFDLGGPASEIVLAVLAWAAKMERLAIGERITAARARMKAKGEAWGRPPRMTADEEKKAHVLRGKGHTLRYIAQAVKVPRATIARCLKKVEPKTDPKALRKALPRRTLQG